MNKNVGFEEIALHKLSLIGWLLHIPSSMDGLFLLNWKKDVQVIYIDSMELLWRCIHT